MRWRKNVLRFFDIFSVTFPFFSELAIYYLYFIDIYHSSVVIRKGKSAVLMEIYRLLANKVVVKTFKSLSVPIPFGADSLRDTRRIYILAESSLKNKLEGKQ